MLETIREYARDKLEEAGEEAQKAEPRHEKWMLSLLGERTPTLTEEWLALVRPEAANLRVALEWALRDRRVEPFVERGNLLYRFWLSVGGAMEGRRWLADAAEHLANDNVPLRARALAWSGGLLRVMCA
jgi:predicted ATPase